MTVYLYRDGRLEGFGSPGGSPETWSAVWQQVAQERWIERSRQPHDTPRDLIPLLRLLQKYLVSGKEGIVGPILEGGCGVGQIAVGLRVRGYRAIGLDFSTDTIIAAGKLAPECRFIAGNVFALPFRDGSLAGYISLGVAEHYREGPLGLLLEARRVLRERGLLLISVPCLNPLRRLRALAGLYPTYHHQARGLPFWEYVYRPQDFEGWLEKAGFTVLETKPIDALEGAWRDLRGFKRLVRRLRQSRYGRAILKRWDNALTLRFCGHMMLFAARR